MDFTIKKSDRLPALVDTLREPNGSVADLTGATVRFIMRGPTTKSGNGSIVGAATLGQARYDWASGDTDTPGLYIGEWEVTYSGSRKETYPNGQYLGIRVLEDLG